ncbi:MAG: excinuclease ABC subunit UvrC [Desulfobacterales bacterium]|nr:excinuclease ABC subunit UvrC [Desulfobacterales bacterium]
MSESFREKLLHVSKGPGVYLMKDTEQTILYVGKARNLKARLSSYFVNQSQTDIKTVVLISKIASFDTIVTATEQEALILESNLIKQYRPRYNVILKDDKRYPMIRLDTTNPYPNLTIVRKTAKDGALYFGPYSSAKAVHQTLNLINKTFQLRKCGKSKFSNRSRPCLNYQMGRCLGPCCLPVDAAAYDDMVHEVVLFLGGRTPDLIRKIRAAMTTAAGVQDFEKAAVLRDKMYSIQHITEKLVVVTRDQKDRDVLALSRTPDLSVMTLLTIRSGYMVGYRHFEFQETIATDEEMAAAFIRQYYEQAQQAPEEILLSIAIEEAPLLENWLKDQKGKKISILCPQRGEKWKLVRMAKENADNRLNDLRMAATFEKELLYRLQQRLKLKRYPARIECFDNSNTYASNPVSGMVVFENGRAKKSDYRSYKLRTVAAPDDYAGMAEVLTRRFDKKNDLMPYPNLLMVDGGKGQLQIACSVLTSLGLENDFDILGIAKKDEKRGEVKDKIFLPGRANPVNFGREEDLLLFLQRIRDESHRFAVSFHRRQRGSTAIESILDTVPGIGKKRKEALLKKFGSIAEIRTASNTALLSVPGMNRAAIKTLRNTLSD